MQYGNGYWRKGCYRSRHGMIFGVCRGVADYLDFSVFWLRAIVVLLLISSGFVPTLLIYVAAALLMKPEPVVPFTNSSDREFYDSYATSRIRALDRLHHSFESLDRRVRNMETVVTSREFQWKRRMGS